VEADVHRLGRVEAADDRGVAVAGERALLYLVDLQVAPTHEHTFAQAADGRIENRAGPTQTAPARATSLSSPMSVWLVAEPISTWTSSPGAARPVKFTALL